MRNNNIWKTMTAVSSIGVLILAAVLIYQSYSDTGEPKKLTVKQEAEAMPTQDAGNEVIALFDKYQDRQKMYTCQYRIFATEELPRPVKFGNFPIEFVPDRYHQDQPFITRLPGVDIDSIDLLKVVPPQEEGAVVVAIRSVERIKGTCKKYNFEPIPPREDVKTD